jgi:hypothetical protein
MRAFKKQLQVQDWNCRGSGSKPPRFNAESVTSPIGDVGASDVHLSGPLKKHPVGKQFAADADRKQAVTSCIDI